MRNISNKIMKVLLEILTKSVSLQNNIINFSLATLLIIINRNELRFEEINQNKINIKKDRLTNINSSLDNSGYISWLESNDSTDNNNIIKRVEINLEREKIYISTLKDKEC